MSNVMLLPPGQIAEAKRPTYTPLQINEFEGHIARYVRAMVKRIRAERGLSIAKFCKKYGIPRSSLYRLERGTSDYYVAKFLVIILTEGYEIDMNVLKQLRGQP